MLELKSEAQGCKDDDRVAGVKDSQCLALAGLRMVLLGLRESLS